MNDDYVLLDYPKNINDDYINVNILDNINIDITKSYVNNIIIDDYNNYFNNLEQHITNREILKQFNVDFRRCNIYYNDKKATNKENFLSNIRLYHKKYYHKILLLCTQAVLADITILLTNYFNNYNLILAEYNKKRKRKLIIKVFSNNNKPNLIIIKYMRLFYLDKYSNDITTHIVKITQLIEINKNIIIKISICKSKKNN